MTSWPARVILGRKERKFIVTFHQTADAMQMEKICRDRRIPGRLIPVPQSVSAGCGMCWAAPPAARQQIEAVMNEAGLRPAGMLELEF